MIKRLNANEVKLCCSGNGCPVVRKIDEDNYEVTDDNGNKIVVKKGELALMADAVTTLDSKDQLICG
jgi:hypothetical protein